MLVTPIGEPRRERMGSFGVSTTNVFAMLDDENEDPQALVEKAVVAKPEPKKVEAKTGKGKTSSGSVLVGSLAIC